MFGDDEELDEEELSEEGDLEDEELEDPDGDDELDPDEPPAEDDEGLQTARKRIDPEESEITHAIDCPLDEDCTCADLD